MRNLMTILVPLTVMLFCLGVWSEGAHALDRCEVPYGATYNIDEHSTCRAVTNNHASGQTIMVPTKSATEWDTGTNAFLNALPSGVTASACSACGTITSCGAASGGSGGYPTGCNTIGQTCADGSIYAGPHPTESGVRLYVTPSVNLASGDWHDQYLSQGVLNVPAANSLTNGITNQNAIIAAMPAGSGNNLSFGGSTRAVRECYTLTAHGTNDWYLPSIKELDTVYSNLVVAPPGTGDSDNPTPTASVAAGQGATDATRDGPLAAGFTSDFHWSSTQNTTGSAWVLNGLDGEIRSNAKDETNPIRCVRRATTSTCAPDLGDTTPTLTCPANITGASTSTQYTATFTVSAFTGPLDLWVTTRTDPSSPAENGGVRINGGAWQTAGKTPYPVNPGDSIQIRITSRSITNAIRGIWFRLGTVTCEWSVRT